MFKHISHIRPKHLSGFVLVPIWPDNRGLTVYRVTVPLRAVCRCPQLPLAQSSLVLSRLTRAFLCDGMLFNNMAAVLAMEINIHFCKHLFTLLCKHLFTLLCITVSPFVVQAHDDCVCADSVHDCRGYLRNPIAMLEDSMTSVKMLYKTRSKIDLITSQNNLITFLLLNSDLKMNRITSLKNELFFSLGHVEDMDLHSNDIREISGKAFLGLTGLQHL